MLRWFFFDKEKAMPEEKNFVSVCFEMISAIKEGAKNNPYGFASILWERQEGFDVIEQVREHLSTRGFTNVFQTADRRIIAY